MATAARRRSDAASLAYHRARVHGLEAENAKLRGFVECVASQSHGQGHPDVLKDLVDEAQEMVQDREVQ